MFLYKEWGVNEYGFPTNRPRATTISDNPVEGYVEISQEDYDQLLADTQAAYDVAYAAFLEAEHNNNTLVATGTPFLDLTLDYTVPLTKNDIGYVPTADGFKLVTNYLKDNKVAIIEEKTYTYTPTKWPMTETLTIKVLNLAGGVKIEKELVTVLSFLNSKRAQSKVNEAKVAYIGQIVIARCIAISSPIDIDLLNGLAVEEEALFIRNSRDRFKAIFTDFSTFVAGTSYDALTKSQLSDIFNTVLCQSIVEVIDRGL